MPLYEYKCACQRVELVRKYERRDDEVLCGLCGGLLVRLVSAPAKTVWSWGDTPWDGYHDRGLNMKLRDRKHREQVMAARNLREVEDGEVEREISRVAGEKDRHERNISTFQRVLQDTGSTSIAMAETFPNPEV